MVCTKYEVRSTAERRTQTSSFRVGSTAQISFHLLRQLERGFLRAATWYSMVGAISSSRGKTTDERRAEQEQNLVRGGDASHLVDWSEHLGSTAATVCVTAAVVLLLCCFVAAELLMPLLCFTPLKHQSTDSMGVLSLSLSLSQSQSLFRSRPSAGLLSLSLPFSLSLSPPLRGVRRTQNRDVLGSGVACHVLCMLMFVWCCGQILHPAAQHSSA